MRTFSRILLALLCVSGGVLLFCPATGVADDGFAILDVKYEGNFDKVSVFVNSVARGEVAHGQTVSLRLAGDVNYQITLKRGDMAETKKVYLAKDLRRQLVFYGPNLPQ